MSKIWIMKEKIEYLLRAGNYTATSLARLLDIQPSGLSHILSGRNKPSFDLVVKILRAFPDVNPDWLLLDADQVYRNPTTTELGAAANSEDGASDAASLFGVVQNSQISVGNAAEKNEHPSIFATPSNGAKSIERVIVLYSDKSFDSYSIK